MSSLFTIPRSGLPPLRFQGELLAESDGSCYAGQDRLRYHDIAVYRTDGGQYVVHIAYCTRFQGEVGDDQAEIVTEPQGVSDVLADYRPEVRVQGYPPGDHFTAKQARLVQDICARYVSQVSDILQVAPEFAEVVQ